MLHNLILQTFLLSLAFMCAVSSGSSFYQKKVSCNDEQLRPHLHSYGEWMMHSNTDNHPFTLLNFDEPLVSYRPIRRTHGAVIAGRSICTNNHQRYYEDPLMHRSICPWYWRVNYNENRIPRSIPEAVCKCDRAETGENGPLYECEPVRSQIRVVIVDRECLNSTLQTITVSVACATVPQGDQHLKKDIGVEYHVINGNRLPIFDRDQDQ